MAEIISLGQFVILWGRENFFREERIILLKCEFV
jgi:hypothetical protein